MYDCIWTRDEKSQEVMTLVRGRDHPFELSVAGGRRTREKSHKKGKVRIPIRRDKDEGH